LVGFVSVGLFSTDRAEAQTAANAAGDLWAENMGHAIWVWWENQSGSTQYMMYRSISSMLSAARLAALIGFFSAAPSLALR
jgi:hypothetical protein